MGLRELSVQDSDAILSDDYGFATTIVVTDPEGAQATITGVTTNVNLGIDHDTGLPVRGPRAFVKMSVRALSAQGLGTPEGQPALSQRPWRVEFSDVNGLSRIYKVSYGDVDHSLGRVDCTLELYDDKRSTGPSFAKG